MIGFFAFFLAISLGQPASLLDAKRQIDEVNGLLERFNHPLARVRAVIDGNQLTTPAPPSGKDDCPEETIECWEQTLRELSEKLSNLQPKDIIDAIERQLDSHEDDHPPSPPSHHNHTQL